MRISYILFDLDDTLYPSSSGLARVFLENILAFVSDYLGISPEEAERIRSEKRKRYGTTLEWLQAEEGLSDADPYFDAIHPTDIGAWLDPDPALVAMLERLPQRASILTNSPAEHAERVSRFLGIRHFMEHIFDLRFNGLLGKPDRAVYQRALDRIGVPAREVLFVDDMPGYLGTFREMGGNVLLVDEAGRYRDAGFQRISTIHEIEAYVH